MSRMLTVILVALCAAAFTASDAFARGGGHGGGGRGGGGGFRGGGGGYHGGGVHVGAFRAGGVPAGAFRAGGVPIGAFRGGAAVHVGGFPGRPVPFGGIRAAPIRRFALPPPLVVGYPYGYGDPYLDYPPEEQCVVRRRLVPTIYGARWQRVTLCYQ